MPQKIALITGANKGLGKSIAHGLGKLGYTVLIGSRDSKNGKATADEFIREGIDAHPITLDVTSLDSVEKATAEIEEKYGRLDALINNAGILIDNAPPSQTDVKVVEECYQTNVFGPIRILQKMLPLVQKSEAGRIVNMSSGLGSLSIHSDPNGIYASITALAYNTSKSALNAVTVQFAKELRGSSVKINSADPGYCATDLNGHSGPRTAEQGAIAAIRLATLPDDGPSGGYFDEEGVVPW